MTDAELIARLHKIACHMAADRIEALIAENKRLETRLGEYNLLWQAYDGDLHQAYVDANEARIDAEAKLAKAVKLIDLAVELAQWDLNPKLRDDMIDFTTEIKGETK
jgi:hypothetical protein